MANLQALLPPGASSGRRHRSWLRRDPGAGRLRQPRMNPDATCAFAGCMRKWVILLLSCAALVAGDAAPVDDARDPAGVLPADNRDEVLRLLAAGGARELAWAATHAARLGLRDLAPGLARRALTSGDDKDQVWASRACLVAFIDLDAVDEVGLAQRARAIGALDLAVMLAARNPQAHRALLLEILRSGDPVWLKAYWAAAANLLATLRDREAAQVLFAALAPRLVVRVEDPIPMAQVDVPEAGEFAGVRHFDGFRRHRGFPPIVGWSLVFGAATPNRRLVADGPSPVFAERSTGKEHLQQGVDQYRADCLAVMLGRDAGPAPRYKTAILITWTGADALVAEAARQRAALGEAWVGFTRRLEAAHLLPNSGAPAPSITVELDLNLDRQPEAKVQPTY